MLTFLKVPGRAVYLKTVSKCCTLQMRKQNLRLYMREKDKDLSFDEVRDSCLVNDSLACSGLSFCTCRLEITLLLVVTWGIACWLLLVMGTSHSQRRHSCWQKRLRENPRPLRPEWWGFSCTELFTPCGQLMAHFQNLLASLALKMDCTNHKNVQTTYW